MNYFGNQVFDGNFKSRADINRLGLIIFFRGQHDAPGGIIDI